LPQQYPYSKDGQSAVSKSTVTEAQCLQYIIQLKIKGSTNTRNYTNYTNYFEK